MGSWDRSLYLLDAEDGTLRSAYELPGRITSVPVAVERSLFVNDDRGAISCFGAADPVR